MTAYELLLSESQERMLIVAHKGREQEIIDVFEKWDLHAVIIGEVTDTECVEYHKDGEVKGNIDADLVLQAMIDYEKYDKAVIVTSDGDFYSLVKYLYKNNKLRIVVSPYFKTCSILLKKTAREKIVFVSNLKQKLEYKEKHR